MQWLRTVLQRFTAQRWLLGVFNAPLSNLCVVCMPVPLRFSTRARWIGRRAQTKSWITGSKRFGGRSLQPLKHSFAEKPRLRLRVSRAANVWALIDMRGLLPSGQIDIAGLQQAVILLERDHCALNVRTVDAVGFNRATTCGTITIRCQGSLHVANAVACFPESRRAIVHCWPGQNSFSKRRLHRQPTIRQITNIVFVLLEVARAHVEMYMDTPSNGKVQTQVVLSAKRLPIFDIVPGIDCDFRHVSNAGNDVASSLVHDLDKTSISIDSIDVPSDGGRNINLPGGSACGRFQVLKNEIFRDQYLVLPQISISIRFGVDYFLKLSSDKRIRSIAASITWAHILGFCYFSIPHPDF